MRSGETFWNKCMTVFTCSESSGHVRFESPQVAVWVNAEVRWKTLKSICIFFLPAGITVLLSLTVFMLLVAEIMPATSDSVPLIGETLCCSAPVSKMDDAITFGKSPKRNHINEHDYDINYIFKGNKLFSEKNVCFISQSFMRMYLCCKQEKSQILMSVLIGT